MNSTENKTELARIIVRDVLQNLHGRKGVGDELDQIEEDIYITMREDLVQIVLNLLP